MANENIAKSTPTDRLIQNNVEICSSVMLSRWTVAVESPKSLNRLSTPVTAVTMPTNPKSLGSRMRARIITEPTRRKKLAPCAHSLAKLPRIVRCFKSCMAYADTDLTNHLRSLNLRSHGIDREEVSGELERHRATVECFGITARSIAFHSPQSHQREKRLRLKPALRALRLERIHEVTNLLLAHFGPHRHEQVRLSQVAVILRNFILQNEMVSECVPGQFRNQAMVLVGILAVVRKDKVRGNRLQLFEDRFDFPTDKRHESILEFLQQGRLGNILSGKQRGPTLRFSGPDSKRAEHHPIYQAIRILLGQTEDRRATANFDVVRMRSQTKNFGGRSCIKWQIQR